MLFDSIPISKWCAIHQQIDGRERWKNKVVSRARRSAFHGGKRMKNKV
jgi:hypothetical protein